MDSSREWSDNVRFKEGLKSEPNTYEKSNQSEQLVPQYNREEVDHSHQRERYPRDCELP